MLCRDVLVLFKFNLIYSLQYSVRIGGSAPHACEILGTNTAVYPPKLLLSGSWDALSPCVSHVLNLTTQ